MKPSDLTEDSTVYLIVCISEALQQISLSETTISLITCGILSVRVAAAIRSERARAPPMTDAGEETAQTEWFLLARRTTPPQLCGFPACKWACVRPNVCVCVLAAAGWMLDTHCFSSVQFQSSSSAVEPEAICSCCSRPTLCPLAEA